MIRINLKPINQFTLHDRRIVLFLLHGTKNEKLTKTDCGKRAGSYKPV